MRTPQRTTKFKQDFKRELKSHADIGEILKSVTDTLVAGKPLPPEMRDHKLVGNWKGTRECHITPDLLLIYKATNDELTLVRLGSHSQLFG